MMNQRFRERKRAIAKLERCVNFSRRDAINASVIFVCFVFFFFNAEEMGNSYLRVIHINIYATFTRFYS